MNSNTMIFFKLISTQFDVMNLFKLISTRKNLKTMRAGGSFLSNYVLSARPRQVPTMYSTCLLISSANHLAEDVGLTTLSVRKVASDSLSEQLRRWTRNPLGSARRGSTAGVRIPYVAVSWLGRRGVAAAAQGIRIVCIM